MMRSYSRCLPPPTTFRREVRELTFCVNMVFSNESMAGWKTLDDTTNLCIMLCTFSWLLCLCCRSNSSVVWMREIWQTTPHLWSLASFSALNSQSWLHHHPQPWSMGKALSRYAQTHFSFLLVILAASFSPAEFERLTLSLKWRGFVGCATSCLFCMVLVLKVQGVEIRMIFCLTRTL